MYNLNKKQKIILGILTGIVVAFICYYVYGKEETIVVEVENSLEIEEQVNEEEVYSNDTIFVHVSGAVNQEGVIELKVDSRISDAIEKAGGLREDAYTKEINLAYKLEDGMKIYIPTIQENEENSKNEISVEADSTQNYITTSSGIDTSGNTEKETQNSKININTATQAELETIPGVGPSTALKIISYRNENGSFKNIEDIKEVSGIGDAKFEKMKDYIRVK